MEGAGTAGPGELATEGRARAVGTDGDIARGEVVAASEVGERGVGEINLAKDLGVGGTKVGKNVLDAAADEGACGGVRGGGLGVRTREAELEEPAIHGGGFGGVMAIVVDDGIAQHAVEPSDGRLILAQGSCLLEGANVGDLQDVLCKRAIVDASLHEGKEALATV